VKRPGPIAASVIAWTLGAAVSVGVGLLALSLIGVGLTTDSGDHLTQPVGRADGPVVTVTPTPPSDDPSASPNASATEPGAVGANRTIDSVGGNVVARCQPGGAYLVSWSPSPGYRADNVDRGPKAEARVSFEGDGREISIRVTCIGLTVHSAIENDDHHEGRG
jgi:hypothetical protein